MQKFGILLILFWIGIAASAQITIQGKITDEFGFELPDVEVKIGPVQTFTAPNGTYQIILPKEGNYTIDIQKEEYVNIHIHKFLSSITELNFQLKKGVVNLEEAILESHKSIQTTNKTRINQDFINREYSGSLAKSLEKIPGIQAMEIGSSTSKPVIRGLGFNRISISENGIKQEGQQWGADHGLEINPWAIEKLEIIKGAGTLEFGSDAMGGVIAILNNQKPAPDSFSGWVNLLGRSSNQAIGTSFLIQQRSHQFYSKFSGSYTDFGDYAVPTDEILYLNRKIPIYQNKLKNTAGNEWSASAQLGYVERNLETTWNISHYYQKFGFFPGAHGIPDLTRVQDDGDSRNVEFPYQNVNHFKISNETSLFAKNSTWKLLMGFQHNHRQEWSEFHTHYGNLEKPDEMNPDLELDFKLSTFDSGLKWMRDFNSHLKGIFGVHAQIQKNLIDGYNFLLPEFNRRNFAVYLIQDWEIQKNLKLNYGLRWDYTHLDIEGFFDPILYQFLRNNGHSMGYSEEIAQRSLSIKRDFTNLNYSLGLGYEPNLKWLIQLNLTSNFRVPTAIELASNGIHHGSFRHERGNPDLNPEKGWSVDMSLSYQPTSWKFVLNPYFYYFQNYIFLQPTIEFSPLPHGGQIYQYTQSEAFITGFEFLVEKEFNSKLKAKASVEYLYNQQIQSSAHQNYPLPFSPPLSVYTDWNYEIWHSESFHLGMNINLKHTAKQERIARNEEITEGYTLLGAGLTGNLFIDKFKLEFFLTGQNLTNVKYYNHMSFYRALEIPEMGRNIQLILRLPFGK